MFGNDPLKMQISLKGLSVLQNTFPKQSFTTWLTRNPESGITTLQEAEQALNLLISCGKVVEFKENWFQFKVSHCFSFEMKSFICGICLH
jgi:hypothetical protein